MKTYILYTTSQVSWYQEQADIFAHEISKTKGRGEVKVVVKTVRVKDVAVGKYNDGDIKPTWEWFTKTFPKGEYDGVIFHFTPYYRKLWGVTGSIGGARNPDNKEYPEFWICADKGVLASGYPEWVTDFLRKFFHEHAHYDEDQDDTVGNILTQSTVHDVDYKLKKIHQYHHLVDYRGKALKETVNKLLIQVIKLAKKFI
jgi:hypothetical protein